MTQNEALSILKLGVNVFLTGEPGAGKTHVVNEYTAYLRARKVECAITASTGIAATHIGGMTIHSWSGIGIRTFLTGKDRRAIASKAHIERRLKKTKVLIIDEISMLSADTLSAVDIVCREVRQDARPFGGIQIVLVGDFFQLPPVTKKEREEMQQAALLGEARPIFPYHSPAWIEANPVVCYITEQHRQEDAVFLDILSAIRGNAFESEHFIHIKKRKVEIGFHPVNVPMLFSKNVDVDEFNERELKKLPGASKHFLMYTHGKGKLVEALKKSCLSPEHLYLKEGAAVMFTKNNLKEGYANGTLGVVEGFNNVNGYPFVRMRDGRKVEVAPAEWLIEEGGTVRAKVFQLPLRLAWAITVHKSQGMSLDEAVMDLSDVFEYGQGYVALSRVRRLAGVHLLGWNDRAFRVHPEILVVDMKFRQASAVAEERIHAIPEKELLEKQKEFIISAGGTNTLKKKKDASGGKMKKEKKVVTEEEIAELRKTHPNAYAPWTDEEDKRLRALGRKHSVEELTSLFGRQKGAITSRLRKLGLA